MDLSLADLAKMAEIINICTQRGAFRADELLPVGELYNKLQTFLQAASTAAQEGQEQQDTKKEQE